MSLHTRSSGERSWTKLILITVWCLICITLILAVGGESGGNGGDDYIIPPIELQKAPYAEWAHHHWVW